MGPIFLTTNVDIKFKNFLKAWAIFNMSNRILKRKFSKKQAENIISGIHAICSLYFSGRNDIKNLRWFSSAYFLHDFIQMFFSKKIDIMKLAYMYHHFSGIYLLSRDSREVPIGDMLFWGELSNLPSYPLYYYLHEDNSLHKEKIVFLQLLQKILYTGIRVPLLTQKLIQYLLTAPNYKHLFAIMPVYLMGIIWGGKIITQKLKKGIDEGEDVAELVGDSSLSTVRLCLFYFLQSKIF